MDRSLHLFRVGPEGLVGQGGQTLMVQGLQCHLANPEGQGVLVGLVDLGFRGILDFQFSLELLFHLYLGIQGPHVPLCLLMVQ